jgi:hypothetical protein
MESKGFLILTLPSEDTHKDTDTMFVREARLRLLKTNLECKGKKRSAAHVSARTQAFQGNVLLLTLGESKQIILT